MILHTSDPIIFSANLGIAKRRIRFEVSEAVEKKIRKEFNNSITDHNYNACISVARELGYKDLAEELQSDLDEIMSEGRISA